MNINQNQPRKTINHQYSGIEKWQHSSDKKSSLDNKYNLGKDNKTGIKEGQDTTKKM